ncbi:MAG: TetR/AcrR family transcriptional regulator [Candidatus Hydrogenedentes bacterium]|nr:TetR/AcrR family transcriptional regulator [Candidatus Hydrogenedentota bacterium]
MARTREFNEEQALDAALRVFWRKGYEGTSLPDLTEAMGINRPSLYAAFGSKEALFLRALERYGEGPAAYVDEALKEGDARAVAESLLFGAARLLGDPRNPRGCFLVQGALAGSEAAGPVRRALITKRAAGEIAIRKRFERARREGDLSPDTNCTDLARYIATVLQGMAVQAAGGAKRGALLRVAAIALRAWPEAGGQA